jgi:F0F1-type ATP synthase membrane subunit a
MRTIVKGESSKETSVDSGVPQGTVLGPIMFLCHINDLPDCVNLSVRLFADDCLLYRTIKKEEDHLTLQADLEHLEEWANKWGMRFNGKFVLTKFQVNIKSQILKYTNRRFLYYLLILDLFIFALKSVNDI